MDTAQPSNPIPTQPATPQPEQKYPFWQHISKGTLVLIIILLIITGGLVYLAIRQQQPLPASKQASASPTPTTAHAFSTLAFVEESSNATNSAIHTVAVQVTSNQNQLSGAQLNIAYDPKVLGNVSIQLGNYFTNPSVLLKTVDTTNGQITLVLGIQPNSQQASGSGTIATISYTLLPTTENTTKLHFLPKTTLTQEGELESILKSTTDMTILLQKPTSYPTSSQSATPLPTSTSTK